MKKQLIEVKNLDSYICQASAKIYVNKSMLLTPGAKDELKRKNISIVYGEAPKETVCNTVAEPTETSKTLTNDEDMERLFYGVAAMAKEELGIDDPQTLKDISIKIVDTFRKSI